MTDEQRERYKAVREKWQRERPEELQKIEAFLEAKVDQHFTRVFGWSGKPDDISPWKAEQAATALTPKAIWQRLAAECPEVSRVGTRNGTGAL